MSSFKRKTPTKPVAPGTQPSPGSPSTSIVSSGIPSLDDILGGGLPLSCSLLIAAPDPHSSYAELVQKYFIAQGLIKNQNLLIVHPDAQLFAEECMWISNSLTSPRVQTDDDDADNVENAKIKIAWRYEEMKQFQTTVSAQSSEEFCSTFDLTCRIPHSVTTAARAKKQLQTLDIDCASGLTAVPSVIRDIERTLVASNSSVPFRICVPALGSADWGDIASTDIALFLYKLRETLRRYPHACASVSLAPHVGLDSWGGPGWSQKLGWLVDAFITLSAFSANPALTSLSPSHHGLVDIHALPAPHTLLSSSDKHSVLRGLSSAATSPGGSGENNLAFKCTRKRLVFETLHLDVEGGVGERRTAPSNLQTDDHAHEEVTLPKAAFASLDVRLDDPEAATADAVPLSVDDSNRVEERVPKVKKPKKRVAFHSDRPDLYDY